MLSQSPRQKAFVEVIPDTGFVVLHGDENNAQPVKFRGVVRLNTPESMTIKAVKIRLEGKRRVGWFYSGGVSAGEVAEKKVFHNETLTLSTPGTHKVKAGVIEWPFEFTLAGNMPESVEGFPNTWCVYNLHADVERPMWNQKDLHSHKHIRLVRTMGSEEMETTRSRTNADIWANKISYSISIPSDAVVFGTSIVADVELAPLRKGITLGKVELKLMENFTRRISPLEGSDFRQDRVKMDELEVAKEEMAFPEDSRVTFEDETVDNPAMEDERYHFKARLPIPKSLKKCRQDVDTHPIHINHRFKIMVNIHNPEGHTSQLVCRLPVKLFISPNLPIDDENQVQTGVTNLSEEQLNNQESTISAPPVYGQHQLDELYSDIQPSGFRSMAPSGFATPALSRRGSGEHVHPGPITDAQGQLSSSALHSRLASLQENSTTGPPSFSIPSFSSSHHSSGNVSPRPHYGQRQSSLTNHSPNEHTPHSASGSQSRRSSSEEEDAHSPLYNMEDLNRIPSYGTALRTPHATSPYDETPPSYFEATSRPPSPGRLSPTDALSSSVPRSYLANARNNLNLSIDSAIEDPQGPPDPPARSQSLGYPAPAHIRTGTSTHISDGDAVVRLLRGRG